MTQNMETQRQLKLAVVGTRSSVEEGPEFVEMRSGGKFAPDPDLEQITSALRENQKLIAIGRLTASIAHEINNPLESIANLLFLLDKEEGLSPQAKSYLDLAQRELGRVVQISKQTLNFYRETPTPVPVHIDQLLEEVLVLYRRRIEEKRLQIRRQYGSQQTVTVFPGEMRQVLSNLIVNAIEAMPDEGTLWLRLRSAVQWPEGKVRGLRITIADNGIGIDPETRKNLGLPFVTTKGHEGTGLGLWVALSILRRHGGQLRTYSSTDPTRHGTVFNMFLPANLRPQAVLLEHSKTGTELKSGESSLERAG